MPNYADSRPANSIWDRVCLQGCNHPGKAPWWTQGFWHIFTILRPPDQMGRRNFKEGVSESWNFYLLRERHKINESKFHKWHNKSELTNGPVTSLHKSQEIRYILSTERFFLEVPSPNIRDFDWTKVMFYAPVLETGISTANELIN